MKKTLLLICAAICAATSADVLTAAQQSYFRNRRICVERDTTTKPGYVITRWHRNGKPDTKAPAVVTNKLQRIVGKEQKNPIQVIAEQWKTAAENWKTNAAQWQANAERFQADVATWRAAATNATARAERITAALNERRAEYVQKRDKSVLSTTKAIYQAFIDTIDKIAAKMEGD